MNSYVLLKKIESDIFLHSSKLSLLCSAEGPPPQINKKLKRRLATLETTLCPEIRRVVSTLASKPSGLDLAANVTAHPYHNPYEPSEESYRSMLVRHKRRRIAGEVSLPEDKISVLIIAIFVEGTFE